MVQEAPVLKGSRTLPLSPFLWGRRLVFRPQDCEPLSRAKTGWAKKASRGRNSFYIEPTKRDRVT